jgi:hypothetical protein
MTEDEWLASSDYHAVVGAVRGSRRASLLFECACCRMLGERLGTWGDRIITAYEHEAEGGPPVPTSFWDDFWREPPGVDPRISALMGRVREGALARVLWIIGLELGYPNMDYSPFVPVVRCVMGNPFRPLTKPPTDAIAALAARADADAVLADALEEAGELAAATHLRTEPHFRGCYVREWALGR